MLDVTKIIIATLACAAFCVFCYFAHDVLMDKNSRDEEIERIKVEKQHEIEVTKQKKRKIWERFNEDD